MNLSDGCSVSSRVRYFVVHRIYLSDFYVQHNKECIIEKRYCSENLPSPLFTLRARGPMGRRPKRGNSSLCKACPPVGRGGKEGFRFRRPHHYGLLSKHNEV